MKKSVLIVEDSKSQLEMMKKLVLEVDERTIVYAVRDVSTAYATLLEKIPKYMFTPVVFVTSLEDTTKYAYTDLNCLSYIEKPFSPERVKQVVKKALNFSTEKEEEQTYCFRKDGILYPVKVDDIFYMESINHEICIHMKKDNILTIPYKTCKQLLSEIDAPCLIQCSRSTIINKNHVYNIDVQNRYISFKDINDKVLIGITFKKKVLAEFENGR